MRRSAASLLLLFAAQAFAHSGQLAPGASFADGFIHPLTGLDHTLAMFAVGLWSAASARRIWLAPASFALTLFIGALLAQGGVGFCAVEPVVAASVLVLGLLCMARSDLPSPVAVVLVAAFALFHGAAHGRELDTTAALVGMAAATALAHCVGIAVGLLLKPRSPWLSRGLGAGLALAGACLANSALL